MDVNQIYEKVQERYGLVAKSENRRYEHRVATAFGYTAEQLTSIPEDANLGVSCGNPLAMANLGEGETVVDLGSGAGFDVFLAAKKVGPTGKVFGVDMNKDMLGRANRNKESSQADNVLFVESSITDIALPRATADCIISNCVVNLVPEVEKQLVFNEMFRLLKPGGRVAISDILLKRELPPELKTNLALYVGCIAGASMVEDYEKYLGDAGFRDILIVDSHNDLNVYKAAGIGQQSSQCDGGEASQPPCHKSGSCCNTRDPTAGGGNEVPQSDFEDLDFNEWAGSFKVYAVKSQV